MAAGVKQSNSMSVTKKATPGKTSALTSALTSAHSPTVTLRLILGDQLNPQHSWFGQTNANMVYVLMEIRQETDYVLHHAQKVLAIFAGMRDLAHQLEAQGHRVHYLRIDDPDNLQSLDANLHTLVARYGVKHFEYQDPDEWRLDAQLKAFSTSGSLGGRVLCAGQDTVMDVKRKSSSSGLR
jgi:deoxyribodipyrimidine photolyase-related protein